MNASFISIPQKTPGNLLSLHVRVKQIEVGSSAESTILSAGVNQLWLLYKADTMTLNLTAAGTEWWLRELRVFPGTTPSWGPCE